LITAQVVVTFCSPDPNFLGWNSELDDTPVDLPESIMRAWPMLMRRVKSPDHGTVTERPLKDGKQKLPSCFIAKCQSLVIELDLTGDVLTKSQINQLFWAPSR